MSTLTYVGRTPDTDAVISPKSYADATGAANIVTNTYVDQQVATQAALLTTQSYVDAQNALLAQQTAVTAADNNYVPTSKLNAVNGVAGLDSGGALVAGQMPAGVSTDRVGQGFATAFASGSTGILGGLLSSVPGAVGTSYIGTGATVVTTTAREIKLASVTIADPGYPWRPLPFGWVMGNSSGATQPVSRGVGTGNYGLLTVMPPSSVSNQIYGIGICAGSYYSNLYPILPYATTGQTPTGVPAIQGSLQLDLYGCCWSGTTYTYLPTNMAFWVWVVPAM